MSDAVVEICNEALSMAQTASISSLTEQSRSARLCNLHFKPARNFCLEVIKPLFATKRTRPAQSLEAPLFGYKYAYQKPADFICVIDDAIQIYPEKWRSEGDYILTDSADNPQLIYIAEISEISKWSQTFKNAFVCQLALRIAGQLARSGSVVTYCENKYQLAESIAKKHDKNQIGPVRTTYKSSWEQARYI